MTDVTKTQFAACGKEKVAPSGAGTHRLFAFLALDILDTNLVTLACEETKVEASRQMCIERRWTRSPRQRPGWIARTRTLREAEGA